MIFVLVSTNLCIIYLIFLILEFTKKLSVIFDLYPLFTTLKDMHLKCTFTFADIDPSHQFSTWGSN